MAIKHRRLLVICPHPIGYAPGQRLKYEQYFDDWRKEGYDITVAPFMSERLQQIVYREGHFALKIIETLGAYCRRWLLLFRLHRYDLVYCFLWVTPFGTTLFERLYCRCAKNMVYDIDDLVYTKNQATPWYIRWFKGYSKPVYLIRHARHVITCTPYLDQFARQYNPHTTDISSTVDTDTRYIPINRYQNTDNIVIGWSGSHSTVPHLLTIANVLRRIQQKYPQVIIRVMGTIQPLDLPDLRIDSRPWSEDWEISTLQTYDIGIYPLPDEPWVYGKSGLKAIQYMALGIPTVATAIGTNFRVIDDGVSGFLVHTDEEWIQRLSELIENPPLRRKIGEKARQKVVAEFSIAANRSRYSTVLAEAMKE